MKCWHVAVEVNPLDIDSLFVKRAVKDEMAQLTGFVEGATSLGIHGTEGEGCSVLKRLKREIPLVQVCMFWGVQILMVAGVRGQCVCTEEADVPQAVARAVRERGGEFRSFSSKYKADACLVCKQAGADPSVLALGTKRARLSKHPHDCAFPKLSPRFLLGARWRSEASHVLHIHSGDHRYLPSVV